MKYILLVISCFYFSIISAQVNTDSLLTSMLLSIKYTSVHDSSHKTVSEKEVKPFLDLYFQMKDFNNFHTPDIDYYNQLQLLDDYSFSTPANIDTIPLTFSTYYIKKEQKLANIRNLAFKQKEALLKSLRDAENAESSEIRAFRNILGIANNFVLAVLLIQSLK